MVVHAKNYETVCIFVKVMQKKPWPLFFLDAVYEDMQHLPCGSALRVDVFVDCQGHLNGREGFFPRTFVQRRPVSV